MDVPEDMTYLTDKDKEMLNNLIASSENSINMFHQLGFLELYLKKQDKKSPTVCAKKYLDLPRITHPYAFECSNCCKNIWSEAGRKVKVLPKQYVIESHFCKGEINEDLSAIAEKDPHIGIT